MTKFKTTLAPLPTLGLPGLGSHQPTLAPPPTLGSHQPTLAPLPTLGLPGLGSHQPTLAPPPTLGSHQPTLAPLPTLGLPGLGSHQPTLAPPPTLGSHQPTPAPLSTLGLPSLGSHQPTLTPPPTLGPHQPTLAPVPTLVSHQLTVAPHAFCSLYLMHMFFPQMFHQSQEWKCPQCSFTSLDLTRFCQHLRRHESAPTFRIRCPFCLTAPMTSVKYWRLHVIKHNVGSVASQMEADMTCDTVTTPPTDLPEGNADSVQTAVPSGSEDPLSSSDMPESADTYSFVWSGSYNNSRGLAILC